ncbi:class I SAM-dependent methyltransferase [Gloeocapsopsis dulcis]|uniref:Methyltransferase type 11 domain-containing protein n=1 Tax=Gloeocapsopsis dulcis AAB1 = 1H9 TaxID=1433147 RepID=A0A6N8FSI2_9CHRO|nr:class I SAM-dependent methyltransferase [Gloeocapsopsis dulcis]MUL35714.1 hypothetical protein [Gloeocapsopsis dulcis AAB1 = 1H9]WNN91003.1 class I SAM-dependent methyltransferase [Gloeocapsopsis dulcis]
MSLKPYTTKIKNQLNQVEEQLTRIYYFFGSDKQCPICQWTGHSFITKVYPEKTAARETCPQCGSCQRHRLAYYLLFEKLGAAYTVLHVAPEKAIEKWLRSLSKYYLSIDFFNSAMQKMDLTKLDLKDSSFDLVWCSHVLEHIPNDLIAMSEIHRVLKSGGKAIIQVPIYGSSTYENFSITSPEERLKHFKQKDHVRLYGLDIIERLESVGFNIQLLDTSKLPPEDMKRYALDYPSTREIFVCSKS